MYFVNKLLARKLFRQYISLLVDLMDLIDNLKIGCRLIR